MRVRTQDEDVGTRIDVVLGRRLEGMSRARAKEWIAAGRVTVNGRRVKKSHVIERGDEVFAELGWDAENDAQADETVPFDVLHECADYVVVNKPAGVPTHPLKAGELGTLCNGLVARYPEMRGVGYGPREPGVLHRLDTGTSGVMLAARTSEAFERLRAQLRSGEIEKQYVAMCVGEVPAPQVIATPIAADPKNKRKVIACATYAEADRLDAQPARTEVLSTEPRGDFSLARLRADAARRHQIRVHLASIGHPLVGDVLYGGPSIEGVTHHCLHASSVRVPHGAGESVLVAAPLPETWSTVPSQR